LLAQESNNVYIPGFGSMTIPRPYSQGRISFNSTKIHPGAIDNHMTNWIVVVLTSGNIEAVSGPAAQGRPRTHEWTVWEGDAADKFEALQCAEKADPRVDLKWMRIRYEMDLNDR
jgi:hypothetical protein